MRVLPTRWWRKPLGTDTERNYVTVSVCFGHSFTAVYLTNWCIGYWPLPAFKTYKIADIRKQYATFDVCLFPFVNGALKGKGRPYSITERRVPKLIPVLGSQPAGDVSHKPGGRLPLLSARLAVTLTTLKRAAINFALY